MSKLFPQNLPVSYTHLAQFELDTGEVVTFFVGDSFRTDDTSQFFYFTLPGYSGVYAMPGAPGNALYEAMFALGTQSR